MSTQIVVISHSAVKQAARLRYQSLLKDHNLSIHLIIPNRWYEFKSWVSVDTPQQQNVDTLPLPIRFPSAGRAGWYLHYYPQLSKLFELIQPNLIHLWEEPWSLVALQAVRLRNKFYPKSPLLLEVDQNIFKKLPPPFQSIRQYVLSKTNCVFARSKDAADVIRQCGYTGPIEYIGYGVDTRIFYPSYIAKTTDSLSNQFRMGYAGRLIPEKGIEDIISAMKLTKTNTTLSIMGQGPYKHKLMQFTAELNLENRVKFFDATSNPLEVAEFMNSVDVTLLMTRTTDNIKEQFGRAIIESQACGVPVIGSNSGEIPITIGKGGWVVPERNPILLAEKIDCIANNPLQYEYAKMQGLQQVSHMYSFDTLAEVLHKTWNTCLSKN